MTQTNRFIFIESQIPHAWYNIVAVREAQRYKREGYAKSGYEHFEMSAYQGRAAGNFTDQSYIDIDLERWLSEIPFIAG
ncbi:hypothetical protein [Comamonas testosteroni]|uniref:hypothetical protein n=1 Tax=Comamonas testosteroni TaxID=285 RepID=UPI0015F8824E|nr:hypothetical protein [Comamonas testosteroni]